MTRRIVVVGGVAAGMSAASQARRRDPACEVIVLDRGPDISYSACGMPYNIGDPQRDLADLVILDAAKARAERGIDVRTGHEAVNVDAVHKVIEVVVRGRGEVYKLPWDRLILATGAAAIRPRVPGIDLPGVFVLRDLDDARAIKRHLQTTNATRALVVGAGYIGMELTEVLSGLGIAVTVLERAEQVLPGFASAIVEAARRELDHHGVLVETGVTLLAIERDGADLVARCDRDAFRAQMIVVATGTRPQVALALGAGLALGRSGAIAVDDRMRTSIDDIFAAGDCAESHHIVSDRPVWIPLGTTANKQGKVAGANAAGADERFGGIVGSAGFKLFDLEVARTGLTAAEAVRAGFTAIEAVSHHHSRARSYPGDGPITTAIVAERTSGRLLGAQMIGAGTVAKRIDVFATALHARMTLAQIEALDLSYAPPFAPVFDPILIAAAVGSKMLVRHRP